MRETEALNPILQNGLVPVFIDLEPMERGTYNADVSQLEAALSTKVGRCPSCSQLVMLPEKPGEDLAALHVIPGFDEHFRAPAGEVTSKRPSRAATR